jgi:GGDEF domain-containing protein
VADAPVDALLPRVEELAKGWLLALVEQAPLQDAPSILAADLSRDGPRICDAVLRALADERDLRRLEPGGALEPLMAGIRSLAGGRDAEAAVAAVDALTAVIWEAVRGELARPEPDQIAELAERLALVGEHVRGAALRGAATAPLREAADEAPRAREAADEAPRAREAREFSLAPVEPPADPRAERRAAPLTEPRAATVTEPLTEPRAEPPASAPPDALWVSAVEDEIARSERGGFPLSLLLVELEEADRVRAVEAPPEVSATFGRFAQSLRSVMRRQDILACETDSRAWVIARETSRTGARSLAERVAASVREAEPWRGAPMTVAVGVAVLGEDGSDAAALIEAAEEAKFAAQASGSL